MKTSLNKELKKNHVILLVVPNKDYNKVVLKEVKKLKGKNICYVTTNKGHSALVNEFEKNKIDTKNFFFIDCVTATIIKPKIVPPNCALVSSPRALTELSLAINKFVNIHFPLIFIDSLSTLLVYHSPKVLTNFVHNTINKVRETNQVIFVMTIAEKDKKTELYKKLQVLVDKVIQL